MSPILFFIIFFICTGVGKIFLQINSAAVAFIDILIAAWEGLGKSTAVKSARILKWVLSETSDIYTFVIAVLGDRWSTP